MAGRSRLDDQFPCESLRESMHEGSKWPSRAGHGGPRKDDMIIEVGLALILWNET